jgi:hypothetical protein
MLVKLEGKRKKVRLRIRCMDGWCGEGFEELGFG